LSMSLVYVSMSLACDLATLDWARFLRSSVAGRPTQETGNRQKVPG